MFDIRIINGVVVDGTGAPRYRAHVGVKGGRIVDVRSDELPEARLTIDAAGRVVAPGFVDMHSHSDLRLLSRFESEPPIAKLSQGITTELLGQDGLGVAPVTDDTVATMAGLTAGLLGPMPSELWNWGSFDDYMTVLEETDLPNNQLCLASHGPLRLMAAGAENRPATAQELDTMKALLRETLQAGAPGLSTGLIYPPAAYAPREELVALTSVVAEYDGVFVIHIRDEGYYLLKALEEAIGVCRESGCRLHISHLQAHGRVNWHLLPRALDMINDARDQGVEITCDRYPYLAGSTVLSAVLPTWMLSGGPHACLQRLNDADERRKVHEAFQQGLDVWNNRSIAVGWDNIVVSWVASEENRWTQGRNVAEIAGRRNTNPVDAVCDLLAEEELRVTMISHYGSEENLERIYRQPWATVGSDGIFGGKPHPRLWGTFPRFFGEYVRNRSLMTLEEGVHRTTGLPAAILGLGDRRGRIDVGYAADLVVFDPAAIDGPGTFEEPEHVATGISAVVVNGRLAWAGAQGGLQATAGDALVVGR